MIPYALLSNVETVGECMKDETIIGDLEKSTVRYLKEDKMISFGEERDDYQRKELEFFLDLVEGKAKNDNDMKSAYQTLKLTQGEVE